jgi:hypothetical protein
MQIREYINQHPALAWGIAGPLALAAVVFIAWWAWPHVEREPQQMAYFYDLNTGELFEVPASTIGPIETESGPYKQMPAGVRAHVYCYGTYREGVEKFVGYLEVPIEGVPRDQWPPGVEPDPDTEIGDYLVRRPDDDRWYNASSPEGIAIMDEVHTRCPEGQRVSYVKPFAK